MMARLWIFTTAKHCVFVLILRKREVRERNMNGANANHECPGWFKVSEFK
jgi:hypothetical protein